jgi:hypothetical protein|tara:strand:- start:161 stop:328 length:168 start_codon:yes stop_codon:yes gene_type:complete
MYLAMEIENEQKGNFWDPESQEFYKWEDLMEIYETRRLYNLMVADIRQEAWANDC